MAKHRQVHRKIACLLGAAALGLALSLSAGAGEHLVPLSKIFPSGKCSAVSPYFELLKIAFAGGEQTDHVIYDDKGAVVEIITSFVNKARDQWVLVGSRRDEKVIFCLYASGIGPISVKKRALKAE